MSAILPPKEIPPLFKDYLPRVFARYDRVYDRKANFKALLDLDAKRRHAAEMLVHLGG